MHISKSGLVPGGVRRSILLGVIFTAVIGVFGLVIAAFLLVAT